MKKTLFCLCSFLIASSFVLDALDITADFPIVATTSEGAPEEMAPEVLKEHLGKIFNREVRIIPGSEWTGGTPAILLKRNNELDKEEWNIESDGTCLTISGGWPRGLFYGVCEFLEKFGGIRWFTPHEVKIPQKDIIQVPDNQPFRRKPAFSLQRYIVSALEYRQYDMSRAYLKQNSVSPDGWPSLFRTRGTGGGHSFWKLTRAVPAGQEKLLPVDVNGHPERGQSGNGPNQLCFSNPEFREFAKKEVAKWIGDEEKFSKTLAFPKECGALWFDLSQNDVQTWCQCKECKALIRKYGTVSGAMLDFLNDIASVFPDRLFQTFAYQFTQEPPKNIRPRDNVMIQTAFLHFSDLLRPMSHPNNERIRHQFEGWHAITKRKAVWGYHRLYHMTEAFPWPQCCFWYIADNIRYYHSYGAEKLLLESEYRESRSGFLSRAFNDLHNYLECKMMDDPLQDEKPIIEEFFQFQYGPAVEEMKAYASYLKKRIDAVPGILSEKPLKIRGIMDGEFFVIVNSLLDRAEAKAGTDSGLLTRIAMERIPVDLAALEMWKQGGEACGRTRDEVIARLEKCIKLFFDRCHPEKKRQYAGKTLEQWEKETFSTLELMRHPLPVPREFEGEDVIQIPVYGTYETDTVKDPEAAYGTAIKLDKVPAEWDHTKFPMLFGIYDYTTNASVLEYVIPREKIPQDEKYHLYLIGRHAPNGTHKEWLYGHRSWQLRIARLYEKLWDPMDDRREYDIYISCKLTGPAYVENSTQKNAVYVDKLLAVKRGFRKEIKTELGKE